MSAHERIQLVDQWNRPIGACERRLMRKHGLLHRATYVLVIDSQQRFCVQLRSLHKDYCPGYWDIAAGGVVAENESYQQGAVRELFEELGVSAPLQFVTEFYTQGDDGGRAFGHLFIAYWNGAIQAQAEEIDAIEWLSVAQIEARATHMTSDSLLALRLFLAQRSTLTPPSFLSSTIPCLRQSWAVGDRVQLALTSNACSSQYTGAKHAMDTLDHVYEIVDCVEGRDPSEQYVVRGPTRRCELISAHTLNAWYQEAQVLRPFAVKLPADLQR